MNPNTGHWANQNEKTFVLGTRFVYGFFRIFGRFGVQLVLYPVVLFYWLLSRRARQASMEYLANAYAFDPSPFVRKPDWRTSFRHFIQFANVLIDKIAAANAQFPVSRLRYEGTESIIPLLQAGRGGIILTAHMGCLELMQLAASWRESMRITVLVHTRHAERFNAILKQADPQQRVRFLQVTELDPVAAAMLAQRVAEGEYIAIAGDRVAINSKRNAKVAFLGQEAVFPLGPHILSGLLQCPVFYMACLHQTPRSSAYVGVIEAASPGFELPRKQREQVLQTQLSAYVAWLERQVTRAPLDWFNFFPFWHHES